MKKTVLFLFLFFSTKVCLSQLYVTPYNTTHIFFENETDVSSEPNEAKAKMATPNTLIRIDKKYTKDKIAYYKISIEKVGNVPLSSNITIDELVKNTLETGNAYFIEESAFRNSTHFQEGVELGMLTTPMRIRFNPPQFGAGASLGPYAGWKFKVYRRTTATVAAFAAVAGIPLNSATQETKTELGFTYGVVALMNLSETFQLGGMLGFDRLFQTNRWPYEGSGWISVSIGYNFAK